MTFTGQPTGAVTSGPGLRPSEALQDPDAPGARPLLAPALGAREVFWAAAALIVPLLFVNAFDLPAWAPRYVVLPLLAGVGVTCLPPLLRRTQRRTVALAMAFGGWAAVATVTAPNSTVALWGRYPLGTGLVFVIALVGAWAGGACTRHRAAAHIERALIWGCVINAAVAVLQKVFDLSAFGLGTFAGRSPGCTAIRCTWLAFSPAGCG